MKWAVPPFMRRATKCDSPEAVILALVEHCKRDGWAGFDSYDALNSPVFARLPLSDNRICRVAFTQALKRLPLNIRPWLGIQKEQNPKAIALLLKAFLILSRHGFSEAESFAHSMAAMLIPMKSETADYWSWGYSFPWQTRTIVVPKGAPNLVCTTFVADALLDSYDRYGDSFHLSAAVSAAEYIRDKLYFTDGGSVCGFSYPLASLKSRVHNANFLGAALLSRVFSYTGDARFLEVGLRVARYSAAKQERDGSWYYGEHPTQRWIDNFHTGYNLCSLRSIGQTAGIDEFEPCVRRGFAFFRRHFFSDNVVPKYFHDRTFPIDIHCVAQSIITLITLRDAAEDNLRLAGDIFHWSLSHMWSREGYFYYQVRRAYINRIAYLRWSAAWMLLALTTMLDAEKDSYRDERKTEWAGMQSRTITC